MHCDSKLSRAHLALCPTCNPPSSCRAQVTRCLAGRAKWRHRSQTLAKMIMRKAKSELKSFEPCSDCRHTPALHLGFTGGVAFAQSRLFHLADAVLPQGGTGGRMVHPWRSDRPMLCSFSPPCAGVLCRCSLESQGNLETGCPVLKP